MAAKVLFWLYLTNAILLITHEFNTPISRFILTLMLGVSTIQAAVTFYVLVG